MPENEPLVMIVDGHSETREWLVSGSPVAYPLPMGYQFRQGLWCLRYSIHYFTVLAIEDGPEPQLACATS